MCRPSFHSLSPSLASLVVLFVCFVLCAEELAAQDLVPTQAAPAAAEPAPVGPGAYVGEPLVPSDPREFVARSREDLGRRAGSPPIAIPDFYATFMNQTLSVTAEQGVLSNDFEPDGEPFYAASYFPPLHGDLSISTTGNFEYTPLPGFVGSDSFQVIVTDGSLDALPSNVRIVVLPSANRPPVALDDHYATPIGQTLEMAVPGLLANDFDPDGDAILVQSFGNPSSGTLLGVFTDGSFSFAPDPGFEGLVTFDYWISDETATTSSSPATVTIHVYRANRAPIGQPDAYYTPSNTTLTTTAASGFVRNDVDPDGDTFIAHSYFPPANGSMSLSTDGQFVYTPNPGFVGIDEVQYRLFDGQDISVLVPVTIYVGAFGQIPTGAPTPPTPNHFEMRAAAPNPFNPRTEVSFRLETSSPTQLRVYDLRGRVVRVLVDQTMEAGEHRVSWDGLDASGAPAASGSYVVELRSGENRSSQKVQLVK